MTTGEAHMLEGMLHLAIAPGWLKGPIDGVAQKKITSLGFWQRKKVIKKAMLRAKSFIEIQQRPQRNCELLTYQVAAFGHPDTL